MQFIYTGICLNNLRYELHKLHFPNFFETTQASNGKDPNYSLLILYLDPCPKRPEQGVVYGFEIHETTVGRVWDSGLDYVRKTTWKLL